MRVDYSKSLKDVKIESEYRNLNENKLRKKQFKESLNLYKGEKRKKCTLCGKKLSGENFNHRNIIFIICDHCKHIQTKSEPPLNYPETNFSKVYLKKTKNEYQNRKERIYKPKLKWIIDCLMEQNFAEDKIKKMRWIEMGSGAGYFLSVLLDAGISNVRGFDSNKRLVRIAKMHVPEEYVFHYAGNLSDSIELYPSDIYVAFFVLEHISDSREFFNKLKQLPHGAIFIFSVPVFGISCLLENIFEKNYARNLDCVLHTQLYTDDSIKFALDRAEFKIIAQWIFGQDAEDFTRFILTNIGMRFSAKKIQAIARDLYRIQDALQSCFDKFRLSDQRHIIAIKK